MIDRVKVRGRQRLEKVSRVGNLGRVPINPAASCDWPRPLCFYSDQVRAAAQYVAMGQLLPKLCHRMVHCNRWPAPIRGHVGSCSRNWT